MDRIRSRRYSWVRAAWGSSTRAEVRLKYHVHMMQLFDGIERLEMSYAASVSQGKTEWSKETSDAIQGMYRQWLQIADKLEEQSTGELPGLSGERYRKLVAEARLCEQDLREGDES